VQNSSLIGRIAAVTAVVVAVVAVAVVLLSNGNTYQVHAIFQNASQIVSGDQVEVAGTPIGTVSSLALTRNGQANLTLNITNPNYDPLRQGTTATVRELSLSGIASRYVDLRPGPVGGPAIKSNGMIPTADTTSEVDLDEIFNTLNGPTLKGLQNVFQGSASQYQGSGKLAQAALQYLNPAVAASSMLFQQVDRNGGANFTKFVVKTGKLVSDLATRSSDLTGLVSHLSTTTNALAAQRTNLAASLQKLPGFMRLANTTFVNLRSALNQLKPLVDDSKPVAPKLEKLLIQLRPLARNAVPTVDDLSNIISRPGPDNDLIELVKLGVPLSAATVRNINADGQLRPGAFPESSTALNDSTPELATARPYAVDLTGWFEGYSHPGTQDANGGASRIAPIVGIGSIENGALNILPAFSNPTLRSVLAFGGLGSALGLGGSSGSGSSSNNPGLLTSGQGDRCPGSMERGGVYYPESGFPCNPSEVPTGK
jgi:phospholipid/cholesterol/gamma-HCH transport system substrate-binding protein